MLPAQMTRKERESRSRLKPYISWKEWIRGTLTVRERVCGKPRCRCLRGQKHRALFLTRSQGGKLEQLYIPAEKEEMVREWVKNYRTVKELLEEISSSYWERLRKKD
ncbi:MAG: DUF6788 family protein [Candidatus Aminicenantales bacterium]